MVPMNIPCGICVVVASMDRVVPDSHDIQKIRVLRFLATLQYPGSILLRHTSFIESLCQFLCRTQQVDYISRSNL